MITIHETGDPDGAGVVLLREDDGTLELRCGKCGTELDLEKTTRRCPKGHKLGAGLGWGRRHG